MIRNNYNNSKGLDQVVLPESHNKPLTRILILLHTPVVSLGMNANITEAKIGGLARLILETADLEHIEMYLKAIWRIAKKGGLVKNRDGSDQEILIEAYPFPSFQAVIDKKISEG
jgi:hypothetical protein